MTKNLALVALQLRNDAPRNLPAQLASMFARAHMRSILIVTVLMLSGSGYAQNLNFNLNNDTSVHTYSLPVECPSTVPSDLATCAGNGNQSLAGAGSVFPECDLNPSAECTNPGPPYSAAAVHIIRVTDATTDTTSDCSNGGAGCSYHPQPSQGAGDVVWDATSTRFIVTQTGNMQMPFAFDPNPASPTYLKPTKLYGAGYSINTGSAAFSKLPPPYSGGRTVSSFYTLQNAANVPGLNGHGNDYVVMAYDFSSTVTAPTIANGGAQLVADLNQSAHCLPSGYTGQGSAVLSISDDDQTFSVFVGPQDTGYYVVVWNRSLGCSIWRTDTATVTRFDGTTGTIDDTSNNGGPAKFYVHESQIYHDAGKVYVQGETCVSGNNCLGSGYFPQWVWETGVPYSGNATPTGLHTWTAHGESACGHNMQGYDVMVNRCIRQNSDGAMTYFERPYDNNETGWAFLNPLSPTSTCYQINSTTAFVCPGDDQHTSWANNVDGTDTAPFFSISYAQFSPTPNAALVPDVPTYYWDNEILVWPVTCYPNCSGNKPYRVAHTYSDPEPSHAAGFADYIAVGSVSSRPAYGQYFVIFTSNWQGQLGCNNGGYSSTGMGLGCPGGHTGMRYDTFIATVPIATDNSDQLTVNKTGGGAVTSSDGDINCGNTCSYNYNSGTQVTLTATAAQGYSFSNWSGCDSVQSNLCTVTMNNARTVTATFTADGYVLSVSKIGSGAVTSSDGDINCGNICSYNYNSGTQVTLTATAAQGYSFSNWAGCDSVQSNICTVTMNSARTVTATFTTNEYVLSVSKIGSGTVTSSDGNINCGSTCSHNYSSGTQVTLTATASQGYSFSNWAGCDSVQSNVCTATMNNARTVTATFTSNSTQVSLSPTTLAFPSTLVGTGNNNPLMLTLTNVGPNNLIIGGVAVNGANPGDFVNWGGCGGQTLPRNGYCRIQIVFVPTTTGLRSANLAINTSDPALPVANVPLTGTGSAGVAVLSPTSHNFGTVRSGQTSAPFTFTLNNTGTATLSMNTINITGSPQRFNLTQNCGSTLAAGANCQISVRFVPQNPGNYTNTLIVNTQAPGNNVQATLTGTGN